MLGTNKNNIKFIYIWLIVLTVISIHCLCKIFPRYVYKSQFDYLGLLVGLLAAMVAILLSWNIYQALDGSRLSKIEKSLEEKFRMTMVSANYSTHLAFKASGHMDGSITALIQTLYYQFQNIEDEYYNIRSLCVKLEEELNNYSDNFCEINRKLLRKHISLIENSDAFQNILDKDLNTRLKNAFDTIKCMCQVK